MKHIKIADFRIIRKVNKTKVKVKDIPKINYVIFDADGEEVIAKKGERGHLILRCPCDHCGTIGIAKGIECRRKLAVYKFLTRLNGRVTDKDINKVTYGCPECGALMDSKEEVDEHVCEDLGE